MHHEEMRLLVVGRGQSCRGLFTNIIEFLGPHIVDKFPVYDYAESDIGF